LGLSTASALLSTDSPALLTPSFSQGFSASSCSPALIVVASCSSFFASCVSSCRVFSTSRPLVSTVGTVSILLAASPDFVFFRLAELDALVSFDSDFFGMVFSACGGSETAVESCCIILSRRFSSSSIVSTLCKAGSLSDNSFLRSFGDIGMYGAPCRFFLTKPSGDDASLKSKAGGSCLTRGFASSCIRSDMYT